MVTVEFHTYSFLWVVEELRNEPKQSLALKYAISQNLRANGMRGYRDDMERLKRVQRTTARSKTPNTVWKNKHYAR